MKLIFIFYLIFFKSIFAHQLMNGECDSYKCKTLCEENFKYYDPRLLMYIPSKSKCEYYSYCSCYRSDNIRIN